MQVPKLPFRMDFNDESGVVIPLETFNAIHAMLKNLEWQSDAWDVSRCPCCYGYYDFHEKDCELARLIHATRPFNEFLRQVDTTDGSR